MKNSISADDIVIEKLRKTHDLSTFDCGDDDLNDFVSNEAFLQMKAKLNVSYICIVNLEVAAFFTISADSIKINLDDLVKFREKHIYYQQFPSVKIGRLGVSKSFQGKKLGTLIILLIIGRILKLSKKIGVRFISVDAYKNSVDFYKKNFFTEFTSDGKRETIQMYLDLVRLLNKI